MIVRLVRYASPSCPFIPTGKQQSGVQHFPSKWTSNQAVTFGWWTNPWHHVGRFLNLIVFFVSPKWLKKSTEIRDYCRTFLCCWRCWRGGRKSGFCTFLLVGEKNKSRSIAPSSYGFFFQDICNYWLESDVPEWAGGESWYGIYVRHSALCKGAVRNISFYEEWYKNQHQRFTSLYTKVKQGCVAMKSFVWFYWSDKSCPH